MGTCCKQCWPVCQASKKEKVDDTVLLISSHLGVCLHQCLIWGTFICPVLILWCHHLHLLYAKLNVKPNLQYDNAALNSKGHAGLAIKALPSPLLGALSTAGQTTSPPGEGATPRQLPPSFPAAAPTPEPPPHPHQPDSHPCNLQRRPPRPG